MNILIKLKRCSMIYIPLRIAQILKIITSQNYGSAERRFILCGTRLKNEDNEGGFGVLISVLFLF